MLSKSNFGAIFLLMLVVFALFQFTGSSLDYNAGGENASAKALSLRSSSVETTAFSVGEGKGRLVLILGEQPGEILKTLKESAGYLKRSTVERVSLAGYLPAENDVILVAGSLSWREELPLLEDLSDRGFPILFACAPTVEELRENSRLRQFLGVRRIVAGEQKTEGIRLYSPLLLGEDAVYEELSVKIPYYRLEGGAKVYGVGLLEGEELKNEELPPLLWRYSQGNAPVFVVNTDLFDGPEGLGLIPGLLLEIDGEIFYPVVNSQILSLLHFPYVGTENQEEMLRRYSRSARQFMEEQLWPSLVSVLRRNGDLPSCFLAPWDQAAGEEEGSQYLSFFMKQIAQEKGEVGFLGGTADTTAQELSQSISLVKSLYPEYEFLAFSTGGMASEEYGELLRPGGPLQEVRTLLCPIEELSRETLFSYYGDGILRFPQILDGSSHSQEEDLRLRMLETGLAFSSAYVDLRRVVFPQGEEDDWVKLGVDLARFTHTYWEDYRVFRQQTVTQAGEAIRQFLSLDYVLEPGEEQCRVRLAEAPEATVSFLYRNTGRELASVEGGSMVQVAPGAWLVTGEAQEMILHLKEPIKPLYYE